MSVPEGGEGVAAASGKITIDTSQAEKAPAVMAGVAAGIVKALSPLDQATSKATGSIRLAAIEAQKAASLARLEGQKGVEAARAQQAQTTAVAREESEKRIIIARQEAQAQTQAQLQANRQANAAIAQQNRVQMLQMRQQGGGGGGRNLLAGTLGAFGGAAGGIGGQVFQTLGAVATLDLGNVISQVIQLGVAIVKTGVESAVAGEQIATSFERQAVAGAHLLGGYTALTTMIGVYTKAAGGAVSQSEALSETIRLNALGFANSKEQVRSFVTAARGISVAMGRGVQDVITDLALAIGNMSTRRLDQLGLSVTEVNQRILELRTSQQGLSRQEAFEQAVIGLSTSKFGDLARSIEAQATPLEQLTSDWTDLGLAMGQLVKPTVDAVAESFDNVVVAATAAAKAARLENLRNQPVPTTPGGFNLADTGMAGSFNQLMTRSAALRGDITMYNRMLKDGDGDAESIRRNLEQAANELKQVEVSLANARVNIILQTKDFPQGAPNIQGGVQRPTNLARIQAEKPEIFVDWAKKGHDIAEKALQDSFDEQNAYDERVAKSERQFHDQLAEQAEDYQRKRERDEESFQDDLARIARDAEQRETKARRDFDQQVAKERRDNGRQQQKWERDFNKSTAKNNEDEKKAEAKAGEDLAEKNADAKKDSDKKLKDLEESYQDERKKAIKDHNDSLADAAAHLDAAAVYEEQRRFARETKDAAEAHDKALAEEKESLAERQAENSKDHDDAIQELQKSNADRNKEEKEAYDQRVSDANEALDQQIEDQTNALAQQLEDARTADEQRLEDMKTAHENQKNQEEADYGLQLNRAKTHHDNEIDELGRQHDDRMDQIKTQALAERDQLQTEFEAQLAEEGLASAKYLKAEEAFRNSSLAMAQKWWRDQLDIVKGVTPVLGAITPEAQAQIDFLASEYGNLIDLLNKAQDPEEIRSLNSSIDMVYEALNLLDPHTYPGSGRAGAASVAGASWTNLDTGTVGTASIMGAGGTGNQTISMGDITIVLGDIGSRSNADVKTMIGEALADWVEMAAKQPARSRW